MTEENDTPPMDKSVISGEKVEIIPPTKSETSDRPKDAPLTTVGQVKGEMGRIYRKAKSGKIEWTDATRAVFVLRGLLKALELEQRLFEQVRRQTAQYVTRLQRLAETVARCDCLASLAYMVSRYFRWSSL